MAKLVKPVGAFVLGCAAGYGCTDNPTINQLAFDACTAALPLMRLLDGETAHRVTVQAAAMGLTPRERRPDPPILGARVWDRQFSNPIGLAAGFDKNAEAVDPLLSMGFGFVEIGSVTPKPQPGNAKPRVFRLPEADAVINRYGFNSDGCEAVRARLRARKEELEHNRCGPRGLLGVNLGKNKTTEDAAEDYVEALRQIAEFGDYLVINISSPNTPGLRALQSRQHLSHLIRRVRAQRDAMSWSHVTPTGAAPPLCVKIAPDLTAQDMKDIAAVATAEGLDGIIVSNTTCDRPASVRSLEHGEETGGLSGAPLMDPSTEVLSQMYTLTKGKVVLVGCGGVSNGYDAYRKIRAGASLVQLYTAFVYQGPGLLPKMKAELAECLQRDGFMSVEQAVGADHK